ncbi:MAG: hypothetical protein MI867_11455 [Pseudomonadales bacterium]|nr:hypothetical protein [Pseudomonadales bacterium]
MNKALITATALLMTSPVFAHPGHGADLFHQHGDVALVSVGLALATGIACFAAYKALSHKKAPAKVRRKQIK